MAVDTLHTIGQIVVPGSSTFTLNGVNQVSIDPALATAITNGGGYVDPSWVGIMSEMPTISGTLTEMAVALANFAMSGFYLPQTTVYTSIDFYLAQFLQGGTRTTSTTHRRVRVSEGLVCPKTITLTHDAIATMAIDVAPTYDGTNAAIISTASVALPSAAIVAEQFTLGTVKLQGSAIKGVSSVTFDFGLAIIRLASDGETAPTFVTIAERKPSYKIRSSDLSLLHTYIAGVDLSNVTVFVQKMAENSKRVAAATAEHCSLISTDGLIIANPVGGSNNQVAEVELTVTPTFDGTNAIVQISAATAIA